MNGRNVEDGNSALHWSIINLNKEWTSRLLDKGANISFRNKSNRNALVLSFAINQPLCIEKENVESVEEKGLNIRIRKR